MKRGLAAAVAAGVVLAVVAGVVWFFRGGPSAVRAPDRPGPVAAAPGEELPPGIDAALTPEERALVAQYQDAGQRRIRTLALYWRTRTTGDPVELLPFLEALDRYSPVPPGQPDSEQTLIGSDVATASITILTYAWLRHGPNDTVRDEYLAHAVRCAADKDEVLRVSCAALLQVVRENPGSAAFPPDAENSLRALLKNEMVAMIAPRQVEAIREEIAAIAKPAR